MQPKEITITVLHEGETTIVKTYLHAYRNLMVLLNDQLYLEYFGECGGQGRCATCLVRVKGKDSLSGTTERNEAATIKKTGFTAADIRLSCQLLINDELDNAVVEILGYGV